MKKALELIKYFAMFVVISYVVYLIIFALIILLNKLIHLF